MRSSSTSLVAPSSRTSLAASTVGLLVEQVELFLETNLHQGLPRLVGGDALPRGEPHGDRLHAERADAGEDTFAAPRHGEVGDVAEVAVQGRGRRHVADLGGQIAGAIERPDHSERRQVDSRGLQAGAAHGLKQGEHHVAARGHCEDVHHPVALWSVAPARSRGDRGWPHPAASGWRPGRESGSPHRAPPGPRSAAARASGRRPAGWRSRAGPACRACYGRRGP